MEQREVYDYIGILSTARKFFRVARAGRVVASVIFLLQGLATGKLPVEESLAKLAKNAKKFKRRAKTPVLLRVLGELCESAFSVCERVPTCTNTGTRPSEARICPADS